MSSLVDLANKISNCTTSECAKDEGIRIYTKLECVPSGKRVITDIINPKNIDPVSPIKILAGLKL